MRRLLVACLLAGALGACAAATPAMAVTFSPRIVGGSSVALGDIPWQVLVYPGPYLCGGSVLDATHVVTAAHCVYDAQTDTITDPTDVDVYAGLVDRYALSPPAQHPAVTGVAVDPDYDPDTFHNDAAILTLAAPGFDLSGPNVQAIALADTGYRPALTDALQVSGWGTTQRRSVTSGPNTDTPARYLQKVTISPATGCNAYSDYDDATQLCAGQPDHDACQGDSGGPLAQSIGGAWRLVGLVSAGAGCADILPGVYTRTSEPGIHAFLATRAADVAPVNTAPPTLSGSATVGGTLSCAPGTWSNVHTLTYTYVNASGATLASSQTFSPGAANVGMTISCVVTAHALGGATAVATSGSVTVAPAPAPAPPTPAPAPAPVPQTATSLDVTPPTAGLTQVRCSRTRCILDLRVGDPAPGSGVTRVEGSVRTTYRTRCGSGRRRRACTRTVTHRLIGVRTGVASFRVTTPRLRAGGQRITLDAVDAAGNRQAHAIVVSRTTR